MTFISDNIGIERQMSRTQYFFNTFFLNTFLLIYLKHSILPGHASNGDPLPSQAALQEGEHDQERNHRQRGHLPLLRRWLQESLQTGKKTFPRIEVLVIENCATFQLD